ncbi:SCO3374 family protein [Streptomyces sp. NPDC005931]|uniref:SCO3374 family protein n=1 Tax=Streptomyces sp. NPDC005931 TaxID=3364737 RepID=UPI0036916097
MVGSVPSVPPAAGGSARAAALAVPAPRRPPVPGAAVRHWYENELGWPTVLGDAAGAGSAVRLVVGVRFDVLDVPLEAGQVALERLGGVDRGFPVAVQGGRMRLLVAAGGAEELPGLLEWLEWGTLALDLTALDAGALMDAPPPPGAVAVRTAARPLPLGRGGTQGAAVWLRPPEPGDEAGTSLPALSATGGRAGAPDLVRLVHTVATQCHRLRLRRAVAGPPAVRRDPPRAAVRG